MRVTDPRSVCNLKARRNLGRGWYAKKPAKQTARRENRPDKLVCRRLLAIVHRGPRSLEDCPANFQPIVAGNPPISSSTRTEMGLGGTGNLPVPLGHRPNGTERSLDLKLAVRKSSDALRRSDRRVAGRNRRVACATLLAKSQLNEPCRDAGGPWKNQAVWVRSKTKKLFKPS